MSFADGFAAARGEELAGFMLAIQNLPAPTSGGARYSPERGSMMFAHGHGLAPGEEPYAVYNALFGAVVERYLDDGIFEHIAHVPAGEPAVDEAWNSLGFGRRTAFAVRDTSPVAGASTGDVRQATPADLDAVYAIACSGSAYHATPPILNPYLEGQAEESVRADFRRALADEDQAIFIGMVAGQPAGILWIQRPLGSPVLVPEESCYIGDTAVLAESRGVGTGAAMFEAALNWARERGYRHAVLHFATANPLSSAFWTGHGFQPVMYQLRHHVDERISWARGPEWPKASPGRD